MTDFGARFATELSRCCKSGRSTVDEILAQNLKRCQHFLNALLREVDNRLPGNQQIFRGIGALRPSKVLSQMACYFFEKLPFHHLLEEEQDISEQQHRKIVMHIWSLCLMAKCRMTGRYSGVEDSSTKTGLERDHKKELDLYALSCLSCPVTNAVVERVFSPVTGIKTKYRNKMSVATLDVIVRMCTTLSLKSGCCVQFLRTDDMLRRFTSEIQVYIRDIREQCSELWHLLVYLCNLFVYVHILMDISDGCPLCVKGYSVSV